jgi:hypothetical protein
MPPPQPRAFTQRPASALARKLAGRKPKAQTSEAGSQTPLPGQKDRVIIPRAVPDAASPVSVLDRDLQRQRRASTPLDSQTAVASLLASSDDTSSLASLVQLMPPEEYSALLERVNAVRKEAHAQGGQQRPHTSAGRQQSSPHKASSVAPAAPDATFTSFRIPAAVMMAAREIPVRAGVSGVNKTPPPKQQQPRPSTASSVRRPLSARGAERLQEMKRRQSTALQDTSSLASSSPSVGAVQRAVMTPRAFAVPRPGSARGKQGSNKALQAQKDKALVWKPASTTAVASSARPAVSAQAWGSPSKATIGGGVTKQQSLNLNRRATRKTPM